MAILSAVVGVCAVHLIPWWSVAIPGGLLLVFVVVARISVQLMHKSSGQALRGRLPGQHREDGLPGGQAGFQTRCDCADQEGQGRGRREARSPMGPGSDHRADVRLEAACASNRTDHRPVRAGRRVLDTARPPRHGGCPCDRGNRSCRASRQGRRRGNARGRLRLTVVKSAC